MSALISTIRRRRPFLLAAAVLLLALAALPAGARASVPIDHIVVTLKPAKPVLGQPFKVTAVAKDSANVTIGDYGGPATWSDSAAALAPAAPSGFVNGVSVTSATIARPVRGDVISIAGGGVTGSSARFSVVGPVDHLDVAGPSSATTGSEFAVTARARDAAGNLVTGYNAPASWSDRSGQLFPTAPSAFVNGVSANSASELAAYRGDVITMASSGFTGASKAFNVVGPIDHLEARVPASVPLGSSFTLTTYARDAADNLLTSYNAGWYWSEHGMNFGSLAPFSGGVSKTTLPSWPAPQHQMRVDLAANAGGAPMFSSNPMDVVGPMDHYALSWTRTDGLTGCDSGTGSLTAKALDSAGNLVKSYQDASPFWTVYGGKLPVTPAAPAPFENGVSANPRVSWSGGGASTSLSLEMYDAARGGTLLGQTQVC